MCDMIGKKINKCCPCKWNFNQARYPVTKCVTLTGVAKNKKNKIQNGKKNEKSWKKTAPLVLAKVLLALGLAVNSEQAKRTVLRTVSVSHPAFSILLDVSRRGDVPCPTKGHTDKFSISLTKCMQIIVTNTNRILYITLYERRSQWY